MASHYNYLLKNLPEGFAPEDFIPVKIPQAKGSIFIRKDKDPEQILRIAKSAVISRRTIFLGDASIGENSYIGNNAIIATATTIGKDCSIGDFFKNAYFTTIEDNVVVQAHVTLQEHVLLRTGTFVAEHAILKGHFKSAENQKITDDCADYSPNFFGNSRL